MIIVMPSDARPCVVEARDQLFTTAVTEALELRSESALVDGEQAQPLQEFDDLMATIAQVAAAVGRAT